MCTTKMTIVDSIVANSEELVIKNKQVSSKKKHLDVLLTDETTMFELAEKFAKTQGIVLTGVGEVGTITLKAKTEKEVVEVLKEEEKVQIYAWLVEAREFAMDAENSNKKHAAFGKYKGRINNYLSKRGYDLVKERKAWYERIKARGGKI